MQDVGLSTALENPIAFHRVYARIAGSVAGGVFLQQCVYWYRKTGKPFYKSIADWTAETELTRREQEAARKRLQVLDVLTVERRGIPARLYYSVDFGALDRAVAQFVRSYKQACKNEQTGVDDVTNRFAQSDKHYRDYTETTQREKDFLPSEGAQTERNHPNGQDELDPVWGMGLEYLQDHGGGKEGTLRSFLGRLVKEHGKDRVTEAVTDMVAADPAEPKAYLLGILRRPPKASSGNQADLMPEDRREAIEWWMRRRPDLDRSMAGAFYEFAMEKRQRAANC